ncbi:MAG: glycosyl transferase, partial [Sulfuricurvum sp. PD_MW2]|uniref:glycosyltransferase family 2 protein n=1 Tax=Sulfuricurvum sp. PD_MW2 TaxID=2027917 RepID=UPI000C0605FF
MKNNQPLVSVIMNCYNSDTYLREAIDSVITQSYQNWEIIFWDNQSTDTSANIIASYNDQRIKYFYAPEHTILGEARNLALTQVSGQLIAFLDCDDLWEEQKLELQVQTFIHDQNIALVYTNYWSFNQTKMQKTKALKGNTIEGYGDVTFKKLLLKYPIGMSTVMISFNKLQLLNEWFDPHLRLTEEFDLFLRISYNGKIKYINAPLM